jgi:serine/threonine protein kinase
MDEPLKIGDWIGGYRIVGHLGLGGQASVYLAQPPGGRQVALKRFHQAGDARAEREAAASRLAFAAPPQPNVATLLAWFHDDNGHLCLVFHYRTKSQNIAAYIKKKRLRSCLNASRTRV